MDIGELKVGILALGEFRRLAPHAGGLEALYEMLQSQGIRPKRIVGGSAGGLMALAAAPWTKKNFRHIHSVVRNLHRNDIFSVPLEKRMSAILAAGALSFPLLNHLEPEMKSNFRILLHGAQTICGIALGYWVVRKMFDTPSLFNNDPLVRLLLRSYDFEAIRKSDVEARVMATDIETGEHIAYSSREEGLAPMDLVLRGVASATLPIHFPLRRVGSRLLTDAEVKTNFPIGQLEDMDVVVVLSYTSGLGVHPTRTWGDHHNSMWDIAKSELHRFAREEYERRRAANPALPEAVFVTTQRSIPALTLESFTQTALERSMQLGYEIVAEENFQSIGEALGRALERSGRAR